jgi:hypothetical protein
LKVQGFGARAGACGLAIAALFASAAVAQPTSAPARGKAGPDTTIAVTCTVAAQAALTACEVLTPGLTPAEQARVLDRASKSTTDPALPVGTRRAFGIVEGLKVFPAGAVEPHLALVREDALAGVGDCMWSNIGLHGQQTAAATLRMGASMQVTRENLQAEPTWAAALAKCDPGHAAHATLADTIIPAWVMRIAARDHLALNGVSETSMRAAMATLPEVRAKLELRTIAVLRNATDAAPVDWTPYLAKLHMLTGDPRARYAQLYFQAEAIHNVLIYQEIDPW